MLRQTLEQLGILRSETFKARLHRFRFEQTSLQSYFEASVIFDNLTTSPELLSIIGHALSTSDLVALCTTTKTFSVSFMVVVYPKLYVSGGRDFNQQLALNSAECFDTVTGLWQALAPMSTVRDCHSASVIVGVFTLCGP